MDYATQTVSMLYLCFTLDFQAFLKLLLIVNAIKSSILIGLGVIRLIIGFEFPLWVSVILISIGSISIGSLVAVKYNYYTPMIIINALFSLIDFGFGALLILLVVRVIAIQGSLSNIISQRQQATITIGAIFIAFSFYGFWLTYNLTQVIKPIQESSHSKAQVTPLPSIEQIIERRFRSGDLIQNTMVKRQGTPDRDHSLLQSTMRANHIHQSDSQRKMRTPRQ